VARSPRLKIPLEDKVRVVLSVLAGEMSAAEAARRRGVSAMSVAKWKQTFLEAGTKALEEVPHRPRRGAGPARAAAVADGDRAAEAGAGGSHCAAARLAARQPVGGSGPFCDLEALRAAEGLPVSRFARLDGIPERTYRRRLARLPQQGSTSWFVAGAEGGTVRNRSRRSTPRSGRRGGIAKSRR
jgi:transposase-like protein